MGGQSMQKSLEYELKGCIAVLPFQNTAPALQRLGVHRRADWNECCIHALLKADTILLKTTAGPSYSQSLSWLGSPLSMSAVSLKICEESMKQTIQRQSFPSSRQQEREK